MTCFRASLNVALALSVARFAELCNPITRQAIELESYPNHPPIQHVF